MVVLIDWCVAVGGGVIVIVFGVVFVNDDVIVFVDIYAFGLCVVVVVRVRNCIESVLFFQKHF